MVPARYFVFIPVESWDAFIDVCDIGGGPGTGAACVGEAADTVILPPNRLRSRSLDFRGLLVRFLDIFLGIFLRIPPTQPHNTHQVRAGSPPAWRANVMFSIKNQFRILKSNFR